MTYILNVFELSDKFRRGAGMSANSALVARIVDDAAVFIEVLSWHDPIESAPPEELAGITMDCKYRVENMARIAVEMGAKGLVLPLVWQDNAVCGFVQEKILERCSLPLKVSFQEQSYVKPMWQLGPIIQGINTVFDVGGRYRGIIGVKLHDIQEPGPGR